MDKLTLAYLAGIIDADGCIGVKKSTYAMRVRKDAQPHYPATKPRGSMMHAIERFTHSAFPGLHARLQHQPEHLPS